MDPTHHMVLKGHLKDLLQMYMLMAHGGTWKIHHEDVPAPVDSYRTHLIPLLWAGWSSSFLDLKLKLIIFFSQPELHVTHFPLVFHFRRGVIHPPRSVYNKNTTYETTLTNLQLRYLTNLSKNNTVTMITISPWPNRQNLMNTRETLLKKSNTGWLKLVCNILM